MTREHRILSLSSAAAAAQYDPSLLLALQAHRPRDERAAATVALRLGPRRAAAPVASARAAR